MAKPRNEFPELSKDIKRVHINSVNKLLPFIGEEVVRKLQQAGPSWTGRYSNSWQIEVAGVKSTGTRNPGEPKPVKSPKIKLADARKNRVSKNEIKLEIRNLARSRGYAQDEREGRFRRGKAGTKKIGVEPRTQLGKRQEKFDQTTTGRVIGFRGDIGGGKPGIISSRTAKLDWFKTFQKAGELERIIKIEVDKNNRRNKGKKLK